MRGVRREPMSIRDQTGADLEAVLELWVAAWTATMPEIDFERRRDWLARRLNEAQSAGARILVATIENAIAGFVMIDPTTGYLDQIAVDPARSREGIGTELLRAAKSLSPGGVDLDVNVGNDPAVRFYEKNGFSITGEGVNANSDRPVYRMSWRP